MNGFVARQNIEHYRELLKIATDPAERRKIEKFLADEESNLKQYDDDTRKK
jgi:hypothetical protein